MNGVMSEKRYVPLGSTTSVPPRWSIRTARVGQASRSEFLVYGRAEKEERACLVARRRAGIGDIWTGRGDPWSYMVIPALALLAVS